MPIYRAVFLDLPILRWLRSTFRGSGTTKNIQDADSSRPSFKTIGQKSTNGIKARVGEEWLQLDESNSTRQLTTTAWSDMENRTGSEPKGLSYPTQKVEVRQTVEVM